MKLPTDNLSYPVKIIIGASSGSGFLIGTDDSVYLVTAKHVIYKYDSVTKSTSVIDNSLKIICYTRLLNGKINTTPRIYELNHSVLESSNLVKAHSSSDIVVFKLGSRNPETGVLTTSHGISVRQNADGSLVLYKMSGSRKFDDVEISNEVFILGYPTSIGIPDTPQIDYDRPLVRKGIIAGKNINIKTIILDCPVYGGNSGGLVLEINDNMNGDIDIHLIGVVVQFVPFVDSWRNLRFPELVNLNYQNSGYSVALPVDYIYDLINQIG